MFAGHAASKVALVYGVERSGVVVPAALLSGVKYEVYWNPLYKQTFEERARSLASEHLLKKFEEIIPELSNEQVLDVIKMFTLTGGLKDRVE